MKLKVTFVDLSTRVVDVPDAMILNLAMQVAEAEDNAAMMAARKQPTKVEKAP